MQHHLLHSPPPSPPLPHVSPPSSRQDLLSQQNGVREPSNPIIRLTSPSPVCDWRCYIVAVECAAMAEQRMRPGTAQRRVGLCRAKSAIQRPSSSALGRPTSSARPRRPYSAYTHKGSEEQGPKYEAPETGREWWRFYLKVCFLRVQESTEL